MKKIILGLTSVFLLSSFTLDNVSAKEVTSTTYITPIQNDEFSIIDSHIQDTLFKFKIINESQLEQKIGKEKLDKLKIHLHKQNIEKSKKFDRGAGTSLIPGAISWADAKTWSTVSEKVENRIDSGRYSLTIDIIAWNMDVQVY